ncbi:hypothetical protein CCB80_02205 [Armatimonadetes bacterium Uphvl-Ar1]|nr:hypothetical protein CCB80_02205 [Armatimonadetes bacterium Uphvl-Ar1]
MNLTPVSSSNIDAIGYDKESRTLRIRFKNGSVYDYHGVPESTYAGLMSAASKGTYLNTHVKQGGYHYNQIS